jgi:hypothetical protein
VNQTKLSPLFKAIKKGDIAKLRDLLAQGEPVDAQDQDRCTPLMRAASTGNAEAFHILVQAGADLHALGMQQADVLESAAEGGNLEIIRYLLDQGLPIEGHWQPRTDVARRMGHMTPLFLAAINARVDAVRFFLERGANRAVKFDDETIIEQTKSMADMSKRSGEVEEEKNYLAVIAMLRQAQPAGKTDDREALLQEVAKFSIAAQHPDYLRVLQWVEKRLGKSRAWRPLTDHGCPGAVAYAFTRRACKSSKDLDILKNDVATAGYYLIFSDLWEPKDDAHLALFPTSNPLAIVTATGTAGANDGVTTGHITDWLRELGEENPFRLRFCTHSLIGVRFLAPLKQARKVAERIVEICPYWNEGGFDSQAEFAAVIKKRREVLVGWE